MSDLHLDETECIFEDYDADCLEAYRVAVRRLMALGYSADEATEWMQAHNA